MAFLDTSGSGVLGPVEGRTVWGALVATYDAVVVSPVDGDRVGALAVPVSVLVSSVGSFGSDVRVEVSDDVAFATTVFASTLVDVADGVHTVTVAGLVDLSAYWVRVRAAETGTTGWSAWHVVGFTVDLSAGRGSVYVSANVGPLVGPVPAAGAVSTNVGPDFGPVPAGQYVLGNVGFLLDLVGVGVGYGHVGDVTTEQPHPRVWFLLPDRGATGDGINVYGWGFGDLPGTYNGRVEYFDPVTGEWEPLPVTSWVTGPAGPDAYTEARTIDAAAGVVTPQHQVVGFAVPAGAIPPGYTVRVVTVEGV